MSTANFAGPPARAWKDDVAVVEMTALLPSGPLDDQWAQDQWADDQWESFEAIVGAEGRQFYAMVRPRLRTYTVCSPLRQGEDAGTFGLSVGTLPGGWYLCGRLVGEPPELYARIGAALAELELLAFADDTRPRVEHYRGRTEVDLWLPVGAEGTS
jgi:hypothetical protein